MKEGDLVWLDSGAALGGQHTTAYAKRRVDKHGRLYVFMRGDPHDLVEAKSVATGAVVTLIGAWLKEAPDGTQL
jgi:hypothetical protein